MPLVIWDGRNPVSSTSDSIVLNADLAPTVASLAGVTFPIDLDGKDLAPILQIPSTEVRGDFLIHHWMSGHRLYSVPISAGLKSMTNLRRLVEKTL